MPPPAGRPWQPASTPWGRTGCRRWYRSWSSTPTTAPSHDFIGHLQRNKVKQVVGHVALIQSVGSLELLDEIEKLAAARGLVQDILLR